MSELSADGDARLKKKLAAFWRVTLHCRECATLAPWRKFPPLARGNPASSIVILGEAPGRVSLDNQRPFSNPRNPTIRNAIKRAAAPLQNEPEEIVYFSDTVKCWPASSSGANRSPSSKETATCVSRHLKRELAIIQPRVIFAFGSKAASAALGRLVKLAAEHGNTIEHPEGYRVIPLMHPSTINIAGMRRVGIHDIADYEEKLVVLFAGELRNSKLI